MALAVDFPDAYKTGARVVAAPVLVLEVALEDARGELEIEAALREIPAALGLIPLEHTAFTIRDLRTTGGARRFLSGEAQFAEGLADAIGIDHALVARCPAREEPTQLDVILVSLDAGSFS